MPSLSCSQRTLVMVGRAGVPPCSFFEVLVVAAAQLVREDWLRVVAIWVAHDRGS